MEKDEVKRCIEDPIYFVQKYVKVLDKKSGNVVPITLLNNYCTIVLMCGALYLEFFIIQ